jgi:hypothetical protein
VKEKIIELAMNRFTALGFMTTGAPPAAGSIRILLMNQYA